MQIVLRFAVAVLEEWKGWLSGSLPMVVLAMIAWLYPQISPLPAWEWIILVFVGGFVCAVFRVYRNIQLKLDGISLKRPFMFETIKVVAGGPFGSLQENNYHFMITLCFENRGDEMISFNMKDTYAAVNNRCSPTPAILKGRIVHPREKFTFNLPRIDSVSVPGFPMFVDVFFDAEYDNVPPIKPRTSMRKIKYICNDLKNPEAWTNVVLDENEA
jgi:hypothetical protein